MIYSQWRNMNQTLYTKQQIWTQINKLTVLVGSKMPIKNLIKTFKKTLKINEVLYLN